jgi:hypothetical protein
MPTTLTACVTIRRFRFLPISRSVNLSDRGAYLHRQVDALGTLGE